MGAEQQQAPEALKEELPSVVAGAAAATVSAAGDTDAEWKLFIERELARLKLGDIGVIQASGAAEAVQPLPASANVTLPSAGTDPAAAASVGATPGLSIGATPIPPVGATPVSSVGMASIPPLSAAPALTTVGGQTLPVGGRTGGPGASPLTAFLKQTLARIVSAAVEAELLKDHSAAETGGELLEQLQAAVSEEEAGERVDVPHDPGDAAPEPVFEAVVDLPAGHAPGTDGLPAGDFGFYTPPEPEAPLPGARKAARKRRLKRRAKTGVRRALRSGARKAVRRASRTGRLRRSAKSSLPKRSAGARKGRKAAGKKRSAALRRRAV